MQKIEGTSSIASLLSCFTISQLHTHDLRLARTTYGTKNQAHTHTQRLSGHALRVARCPTLNVAPNPSSTQTHPTSPDPKCTEVPSARATWAGSGANPGTIPHKRTRGPADASPRRRGRRATTSHGYLRRISRGRMHRRSCGRRTHVRGGEPFLRGDVTVAGSERGRVHFCRWHTPSSLPCFANTLPAESQRRCISLKSCDGQERKPRYHQLPQNTHIKQVQVDR